MITIRFNQLLYVLPFDHRRSFQSKMFAWPGSLQRGSDGRDRFHVFAADRCVALQWNRCVTQ